MKRLLASTTALSVAMFNITPWPLMAQTLAEDGTVVAADGTVLCEPTADAACDPAEYVKQARKIEKQMAAQAEADAAAQAEADAAAQAEADAAAQAEADAAAQAEADAAAQAEADAAAQAEADAAAQAEADAAAQAEADAAAQAEADAAAQAEADAAAQAEADAAAQAEADAAAQAEADKAAQAEADAAAQAEADAAAQAEADKAAQAEADAAAQAEAGKAAQAEADAAAQAEADKAAQAEADAAAQAEADKAAQADAAAQAEADAAAQAEADKAAQTEADAAANAEAEAAKTDETAPADPAATDEATVDPATDPAATPEAPVLSEPVTDPTTGETVVTDQATGETLVVDPATGSALTAEEMAAQTAEQEKSLAAAQEELAPAADGTIVDPNAGLATAEAVVDPNAVPVDAPVVSEAEVQTLSDLVAKPAAIDPAKLGAAETLMAPTAAADGAMPADAAPSEQAVTTVSQMLTKDAVRRSTQEFTAPPVALANGKKSGLSDLEKVGLIVLGSMIVGQVIGNIQENNQTQTQPSRVVSNTGDRVIILKPDGTYQVYKDDDATLRQPGSNVRTETFRDGSTRTIVQRADGSQVVTIRDVTGRVLRRAQYDQQGHELVLIDDLEPEDVVIVRDLPKPRHKHVVISTMDDDAELKAELAARDIAKLGRKFSLRQIREIQQVRWLAATIDVDNVNFDSGSSAIRAKEASDLADLGSFMQDMLEKNPREMFLIEGHTDATGKAAMNLALSDRRAESVALALSENFDIPPENMVIQGYGETELRIDTLKDEPRNRRVSVRIITPLLRTHR